MKKSPGSAALRSGFATFAQRHFSFITCRAREGGGSGLRHCFKPLEDGGAPRGGAPGKITHQSIMKRILSLIFLLPALAVHAQQDTLKFPDMNGAPGGVFLWPVELAGTSPVVGVQFDLVYPAGQLAPGTALAGAATTSVLTAAKEIAPGRSRVAVSSTKNAPLAKDSIVELPIALPATSPGGGPAFTIEHIILALADGSKVPAAVTFGPLTEWRKRYFTPEELLQAALVGDDADPDNDGTPNLLEYAVGGNPRRSLPGEKPTAGFGVIYDNGQRKLFLAMNYRRALNAPGILFQPEVSEDLLHWVASSDPIPSGAGDANSIPMQARVAVGTKVKLYLRLKVSRRPE